jgi:hypothetical protein
MAVGLPLKVVVGAAHAVVVLLISAVLLMVAVGTSITRESSVEAEAHVHAVVVGTVMTLVVSAVITMVVVAAIAVMKFTAVAKNIFADIVSIDANSMVEGKERAALTGGKRPPPIKDIKNIIGGANEAESVGQVRERLLRCAHLGRCRNLRHTRRHNLQRQKGQTAEGRVT